MSVKAKKHLGQHFLTDENIAQNCSRDFGSILSKYSRSRPWNGCPYKIFIRKASTIIFSRNRQ